jgi:hypothetical protein
VEAALEDPPDSLLLSVLGKGHDHGLRLDSMDSKFYKTLFGTCKVRPKLAFFAQDARNVSITKQGFAISE